MRESDDEDGVDRNEAKQVAGDHPVNHDHERADDLDASEDVKADFLVPSILTDGYFDRRPTNSKLLAMIWIPEAYPLLRQSKLNSTVLMYESRRMLLLMGLQRNFLIELVSQIKHLLILLSA